MFPIKKSLIQVLSFQIIYQIKLQKQQHINQCLLKYRAIAKIHLNQIFP